MRYISRKITVASALTAALLGLPGLAAASAHPAARTAMQAVPPTGPVSPTPAAGTPHLLSSGSDIIRQLVQCGNTMYAVGTFSQIQRYSTTYTRTNIFSFSATAPYTMTSWAPAVNGEVNSIAFANGNCADAYIGGKFTQIGATSAKNIAEIDTTSGNMVTTFAHSASAQVETLLAYGSHLIVGGYYTGINGSSADPYMTSLNATTGKDDHFVSLGISGNYNFPGVTSNATRVYNQSLSHSGTLDLVMGDFTTVGGLPRQQIFMLNLATSKASVTRWTSPQWDGSQGEATPADPTNGYPYQCATVESFYIQAASWSPDDSTVYIGTTGYHPNNWPTGGYPRNGLCDAAAAFPATQTSVLSNWINYTGCDSLYSTAADASTAYFGGHERWSTNPNGCDFAGPGAISAPGMEGLTPHAGTLLENSQGGALYTRDRGYGADDMLLTSAGLWIASDNHDGASRCGGVYGHSGICLLPYPST